MQVQTQVQLQIQSAGASASASIGAMHEQDASVPKFFLLQVPTSSKSPTVVAGSVNTAGTSEPGLLQHKKAVSMNGNWVHICNSPSVCALPHLVDATPPYGIAPPHVDDLHQAVTSVATPCAVMAMPWAVTTTLLHPAVAGNASLVVSAAETVRFHSCVIQLSFTVYLCSVAVHNRLNWVAIVMVDCSCDALQPIKGSLWVWSI